MDLVRIANEAVAAEQGLRLPSALISEVLYGAEVVAKSPFGTGSPHIPSAAEIFDAFAHPGREGLRQHLEQFFEVVAAPRARFDGTLRPGDLLVRRALGEGNLAHVAMLATGETLDARDLESAGLTPESGRHGLYAQVLELGVFPKNVQDRFARRLADESGRLDHDQMILRLRRDVIDESASGGVPIGTSLSMPYLRAADIEGLQEEAEGDHSCRVGEGPPAVLPDPEGKGPHPLVLKGDTKKFSRNPTVGDAQQLLNRFLKLTEGSFSSCDNTSEEAIKFMTRNREILKRNGQDPLVVDCRFGQNTEIATKIFQACRGITRDGKIGPITWGHLVKLRTTVEKVEIHPSDTDTHKIPSALPGGKDHFVCVKNTGDIVLQATVKPDLQVAKDEVVWEADGAAITSPAVGGDKTTAKLSSADSKKIPIRIKVRGTIVYEGFVWVVWSVPSATAHPITSRGGRVPTGDGTVGPGLFIQGGFDFTFTITPATVITDPDRPDLSGINTVPVPGAAQTHVVSGNALVGGADRKWDCSRQVRVKNLNPKLYTTAVLDRVGGHLWNGQPALITTPELYPADKVLGNDDTHTGDENNDPYTNGGRVMATDTPTAPMRHSTGADNDTFETRVHFIEFLRVNLENKWYRASDDFPWRIHYKFRRIGGVWTDNGTDQALDNAGF